MTRSFFSSFPCLYACLCCMVPFLIIARDLMLTVCLSGQGVCLSVSHTTHSSHLVPPSLVWTHTLYVHALERVFHFFLPPDILYCYGITSVSVFGSLKIIWRENVYSYRYTCKLLALSIIQVLSPSLACMRGNGPMNEASKLLGWYIVVDSFPGLSLIFCSLVCVQYNSMYKSA